MPANLCQELLRKSFTAFRDSVITARKVFAWPACYIKPQSVTAEGNYDARPTWRRGRPSGSRSDITTYISNARPRYRCGTFGSSLSLSLRKDIATYSSWTIRIRIRRQRQTFVPGGQEAATSRHVRLVRCGYAPRTPHRLQRLNIKRRSLPREPLVSELLLFCNGCSSGEDKRDERCDEHDERCNGCNFLKVPMAACRSAHANVPSVSGREWLHAATSAKGWLFP